MLNTRLVSRVTLATLRPTLFLLMLLLLTCTEASPIEIVFCYTSVDCPHAVMYCDETLGFCFNCSDVTRCASQFYPHDYDDCRRRCPGESDIMRLDFRTPRARERYNRLYISNLVCQSHITPGRLVTYKMILSLQMNRLGGMVSSPLS